VRWQTAVHRLRAVSRCKSVPTCPGYTWELICTVFKYQNWLMPVLAKNNLNQLQPVTLNQLPIPSEQRPNSALCNSALTAR